MDSSTGNQLDVSQLQAPGDRPDSERAYESNDLWVLYQLICAYLMSGFLQQEEEQGWTICDGSAPIIQMAREVRPVQS